MPDFSTDSSLPPDPTQGSTSDTSPSVNITDQDVLNPISYHAHTGSDGSPQIDAGNLTGTISIAHGGTGKTTQQTAIDALLPSQGSSSGKFLTTNGTTSSWGTVTTPAMTLVTFGTFSQAFLAGTITSVKTFTGLNTNAFYRLIIRNFRATAGTANWRVGMYFNGDNLSNQYHSKLIYLPNGSATVTGQNNVTQSYLPIDIIDTNPGPRAFDIDIYGRLDPYTHIIAKWKNDGNADGSNGTTWGMRQRNTDGDLDILDILVNPDANGTVAASYWLYKLASS